MSRFAPRAQRFRIEPRLKVRIGRLAKVLSIFGPATEATDNSRGFFEGGSGSATPFEGFTSRKIAMKIPGARDRKSTRLNSSHITISYAVFCLKKKKKEQEVDRTET